MLGKYDEIIKDEFSEIIIEEIPKIQSRHMISYLPHHLIVTPSKQTTKVRIVFDAYAKSPKNDLSLNKSLCRGSVLLHDLCGILLRF